MRALEGFFSAVYSTVLFQMVLKLECFPTLVTLKASFSFSVINQVLFKFLYIRKCLVAYSAALQYIDTSCTIQVTSIIYLHTNA